VSGRTERSRERIDISDLERLAGIARVDRAQFLQGRPEYRGRLICVALCQGAGLHYVDMQRGRPRPNGVKDFDVWSFFAAIPGARFPAYRRHAHVDFGPSKFGRWRGEPPRFRRFEGRRVDLFMRDLRASVAADPVRAMRQWLKEERTGSQRALAAKGVVLLQPRRLLGTTVWPIGM
jgi:hypothetical protein